MILTQNMKEQFTYEILLKYKNNPYKDFTTGDVPHRTIVPSCRPPPSTIRTLISNIDARTSDHETHFYQKSHYCQ